MRAKFAKQRNKKHVIHLLSSDPQYNHHPQISEYEKELQDLLPKRRQWKKLRFEDRRINGQALNSVDKNIKSLLKTIKFYEKRNPDEPFLNKLNGFISDVCGSIVGTSYKISRPEVYPKRKDDEKAKTTKCRPISLFHLKDKIITCLANRYLTELFDNYFYENSLAFRARRVTNGRRTTPTHHEALKKIKEYLGRYSGRHLWVAECDMMKFYDTVNHSVIRRAFRRLMRNARHDNPGVEFESVERVIDSYLKCYTFNRSVFPYNKDPEYFKKYRIRNGEFSWVEKELIDRRYYKSLANAKIGVPQGGALSGLIANIVLDYADRQVLRVGGQHLLYIRYCDDMIVIHPNKRICQKAFAAYRKALTVLKLVPHDCSDHLENRRNSFWTAKSKLPYRWDGVGKCGIPWIGFVGYEINRDGDVRVRKKSLEKERRKQYDIVNRVWQAVKDKRGRVSNKAIEESVINQLIGRSVGRVQLWNASAIRNEMCWVDGFTELTDNEFTRTQMKQLDAYRNKLVRMLAKRLNKSGGIDGRGTRKKQNRRSPAYYGKPFSYYYQVIERRRRPRAVTPQHQESYAVPGVAVQNGNSHSERAEECEAGRI
jgi:hypothetical protein